ncbi:MAG TPA: valine--tRNA ligase [Anaerolineae bacterium]|nr:valine--tRNA ligase [Anaerolineae bacterium]HQH37281.1 valine--tRNA ligase [Anaerolineae bacterium]
MTELSKTYNPKEHEQQLYQWWESKGYFKPETLIAKGLAKKDGARFCITMPPPNVTGILHLGHAMTATIEDLMTRYYRMRGCETLFLPGSDHAGIATQNVVERELAKEGLTRHDLGRDAFIEKCWEWKEKTHARITDQHRQLGITCDWERERFTLDPGLSHAVRVAFHTLYERGLIYRGPYMVNWCPRCESAISDLEVEPTEHDSHLWYIRYPVVNADWSAPRHPWGSGRWAEGATTFIEMATTRPETILGDSGVAVHPDDPRWQPLIGQTAILPALGRAIPIVADAVVEPAFGTGAVKVTPAHDPTDYEIGMRHHLLQVDVMTPDGMMNAAAGPYVGLERYACRDAIVADFEKEGLLVKIEPYHHSVGHCQRCDTIVEPRISTQWFVRTKPLAAEAIRVVRDGTMHIIPDRFEKTWFHWMENIRDWCISRQLWWGHRIPVWYCQDCHHQWSAVEDPTQCPHCGSRAIVQDEDVLDTWFSSGLWPFSTLGWPAATADMQRFFPTDMRETGYDILFFWVARETMLSLALLGQAPYSTVYLHGLIRNEHGDKISKSMPDAWKYDPLYIIDEYGTDALRYTLATSSTPGNDMNLDPRRLEGARNFANKIWQATRFILMNVHDANLTGDLSGFDLMLEDRWILSRMERLTGDVFALMETQQYGEAGRRVRDFLWDEFCDWYIEASKVRLYAEDADKDTPRSVLLTVLERALRLLHPFMPFVTEALWQALPPAVKQGEALIVAPWPMQNAAWLDDEAEAQMTLLVDLVRGIRNVRSAYNVEAGRRVAATVAAGASAPILEARRPLLTFLAHLDADALSIVTACEPVAQSASALAGDVVVYLPLAGLVDIDAERTRLQKALENLDGRIHGSRRRLDGPFAQKAPADVVQHEREHLAEMEAEAAQIREQLTRLG